MHYCPICKSPFSTKGMYSECSKVTCPTLLINGKALHIDFAKIKEFLNTPVLKTNKLAKSFLKFLNEKGFLTAGQLIYIVGDISPKGGKTLKRIALSRISNKQFDFGTWYTDIPKPIIEDPKLEHKPKIIKKNRQNKLDNEIVVVTGKEELYPCKDFKHIKYEFDFFNPLQSTTLKYIDLDVNVVVAAPTSSGKTIVAEQFIAPIVTSGKKAIYISPLKALAKEKHEDWTDEGHSFSQYKIEMLTGDYILSKDRVSEISQSNIILLTSEMLDNKTRKIASEQNDWLYDVGVVVVDEAHLLAMNGRGDILECAILRFTEQNPSAKIVLLSATMPNVEELANWLSSLNGKQSVLVQSDWRPVKLDVHFPTYEDIGDYSHKEHQKMMVAIRILKEFPDDKFIVFVHTKKMGKKITEEIRHSLKEEVEFHFSDLTKDQRQKLEKSFKQQKGGLRILVSTSTLAWGINAPARRVIVIGVHRGLDTVTVMEIIQMIGRSGRYLIDEKGDAYVLLPHRDAELWVELLQQSENVISRMTEPGILIFHIVSEIVRGVINNREELKTWYSRTLASFQGSNPKVDNAFIKAIEDVLQQLRMVKIVEDEYTPTGLGKVSAWMYYQPTIVYNWYNSFDTMVKAGGNPIDDPLWLSYIVSMDSREYYPPSHLTSTISAYTNKCLSKGITKIPAPVSGAAIYQMCTHGYIDEYFLAVLREIKNDMGRITQSLSLIDNLYGMWKKPKELYNTINAMILYDVPKELAPICQVKWVGGKKAKDLYTAGVRKVEDFVVPAYDSIIRNVLHGKTEEAIESAKNLLKN